MNKNNGLDEMQKGRRDHIGNQMFMVMYFALMVNGGLPAFGVHWLAYPGSVMVIITACMGIYLARLISLGAYLPPKAQNRKTVVTLVLSIGFSIALAVAMIKLFGQTSTQVAESSEDNSAIYITLVSAVGLILCLIVAAVKKADNKDTDDD
jgi:TRAP-type C4-dicarboxylate transport system permease small subunit